MEPFAGSACLFFELAPKTAVLGDSNRELIEVYRVVRDEPERLYRGSVASIAICQPICAGGESILSRLIEKPGLCAFCTLTETASMVSTEPTMDGKFNVPMGTRLGEYFSKDDLLDCSKLLQRTTLVAGDFVKTLERVKAGDFVYLDPPYAVTSRTNIQGVWQENIRCRRHSRGCLSVLRR